MSRPLRLEFPGALYHVTSRGDNKKTIYFEENDFSLFLDIMGDVCKRYHWIIHSYCLMTNHYHLLLETPEANLSKGMRDLNGIFTQAINRKHRRVGHLFQGRYKSILVDKDNYYLELCRYIVLNPVRARIIDSPEKWSWSSWHFTLGNLKSPEWLATNSVLECFSDDHADAIKEYADFVKSGVGISVWDDLHQQVFLGSDDFIEKYQGMQGDLIGDLYEIPLKQRRKPALPLWQYLLKSNSRDDAICLAYRSGGYTLKNIGDHFNLHYSRISRIVAKNKT